MSFPFSAKPFSQDSVANTANSYTIPAVTGKIVLMDLGITITGASTGNAVTITVYDGDATTGTIIRRFALPSGSAIGSTSLSLLTAPFYGTVGKAMTIVAAAGGSSCVTTINGSYFSV
jgi:hypothetical protein